MAHGSSEAASVMMFGCRSRMGSMAFTRAATLCQLIVPSSMQGRAWCRTAGVKVSLVSGLTVIVVRTGITRMAWVWPMLLKAATMAGREDGDAEHADRHNRTAQPHLRSPC